ncbi:DUF6286 domain-containing protein [Streptomyces sp. AK02-04a]|uniref:DUF6286 domain-containing protein n=1 Tax=Streptomyces sp. AK02-04a TaxID=3028649 RepID=UPI0029B3BCF1|nr:DUF6286 domain-containing protein [Streptomyces sp. AK02-04a]MDX3763401.1 DUF6286 domain-containing protein [Streptomyces sp. AK02-04a]
MSTPGAAERGRTTVGDRVVRRIAERAAAEALPPGEIGVIGAKVTTGGGRAGLTVDLTLPYRVALEKSGNQVHQYVAERTAKLSGLTIRPARIRVRVLTLRAKPASDGLTAAVVPSAGQETSVRSAKRMWSQRRLPAALVAILGIVVCTAGLYEFMTVHVMGGAPLSLWSRLLTWLSTHGPGDSTPALDWVTLLLGFGLILLAVTPGRRRSLTMRSPDPGMRAALNRSAAESLVSDAVSDVYGISHARVRVGGRRARIRAAVEFGDRDAAYEAVMATAHETLAACGLRRTPRLRVRVRTAPGRRTAEQQERAPHDHTAKGELP